MELKQLCHDQAVTETARINWLIEQAEMLPATLNAVICRVFEYDVEFLTRFAPEAAPNMELYECHMAGGQTRIAWVVGCGFDEPEIAEKYIPTEDVIEWVQLTPNA